MNDEERLRRAEQARVILEHPLWVEAWESVRASCISAFENTALDESAKREEVKRLHSGAKAARMFFERLMKDGKAAAADIEYKQQKRR